MSNDSNNRPAAGRGTQLGARPGSGPWTTRSLTLLILVLVDFVVAVMMVFLAGRFVVSPDPAVKAGPMYVVLVLTTGAAVLMFVLALNASFVPLLTPQRARDVRLVMWSMGATGVVTGMLTLGGAVQGIVLRLFVGVLAFVFISVQEARWEKMRRNPPPQQAAAAGQKKKTPQPKARQRRGGKKH
jgi:hypothetical protein